MSDDYSLLFTTPAQKDLKQLEKVIAAQLITKLEWLHRRLADAAVRRSHG
jgi:mRNA-degrading endonuclease RelE of RelBE toxin-antitoxin system